MASAFVKTTAGQVGVARRAARIKLMAYRKRQREDNFGLRIANCGFKSKEIRGQRTAAFAKASAFVVTSAGQVGAPRRTAKIKLMALD